MGRKQTRQHEWLFWEIYELPVPFQQAVRLGKWKGWRSKLSQPIELHDLEADPTEKINVAARHPDVVRQIERIMAREHTPTPFYDTQ